MMNDTYGINMPYYITPSGFNAAIFFFLVTALLGLWEVDFTFGLP